MVRLWRFGAVTMMIFGALALSSPALAAELTLSPTQLEIEVNAGETYTGSFQAQNTGSEAVSFRPVAGAYFPNADGTLDYNADNDYTQIAGWLSFTEAEYTLSPGETASVEFTLTVPADAVGGGQYGVVYAEVGAAEAGEVLAVTRVGVLLIVQVNGAEVRREGALVEQKLPNLVTNGELTPSATVENSGNVNFKVESALKIKNLISGKIIYDNTAEPTVNQIYPGQTRTLEPELAATPSFGVFAVTYTVAMLGETYTLEKTVVVCPLTVMILGVVMFAILTIWVWIKFARGQLVRRR